MPHGRRITLHLGPDQQHVIASVTVMVNITPIPPDRQGFPGADSGMAIELPAVQQLLDLIAEGKVDAEQARAELDRAAMEVHDANDEFSG